MKRYRKGYYRIKAERVEPGKHFYNYLEDCRYESTDIKCIRLIGTMGEEWLTTLANLAKTYTYVDGTPITVENIPSGVFEIATIVGEDAEYVFAEQTREQVQVATSWGDVLTANRDGIPHGDGDYIVYAADKEGKPDPTHRRVVNGLVFPKTYEEA